MLYMKYHILPIPDISKRKTNEGLSKKVRQSAIELNFEALHSIEKTNKQKPGTCFPTCFYLYDKESVQNLMKILCDKDEIIVHGESMPFIFGLNEPSPYDLHAQSFAKLLYENKMPDRQFNIILLSCQTATTYSPSEDININFARDMSKALHSFGYKNIKVTGYTGFVVVKKGGKYSVSSIIDKSTSGTHASLDKAQIVYLNGEPVLKGRIMTENLSDMSFDWAKEYIAKAILGQKSILPKAPLEPQTQIERPPSPAMQSFFKTNTQKEHEPTELIKNVQVTSITL